MFGVLTGEGVQVQTPPGKKNDIIDEL